MSENPLSVEQQQRMAACDNAARFLRDGGAAVLGANTSKAGHVVDIIDLAHYIVTGNPYGVDHAHEHIQQFPGKIAAFNIEPGTLQADALGGMMKQAFGFNPFEEPDTQADEGQTDEHGTRPVAGDGPDCD